MDSDQGKLFIGGISWETTEDRLKEYFGNYGEILQAVVMRDKLTGRPRGFGFVVFADPSVLDTVLQDKHNIDGRTVEAKRALSREEQVSKSGGIPNSGRSFGGGGGGGGSNTRTKKIFVGGLPPTITEEGFRQYFETYGQVVDVVVMYDQQTNRPRGFGFISFDSEDAVDRVLHKTFHDLNGKQVEVKRALPKDANSGGGGRSMDAGSGGGGYQGGNSSSYEGRMDSSRYQQNSGGGFPSYGSTGGYGYGGGNTAGSYGSFGGFGGQAGGAYGNANVPPYGGGQQSAPRNSWASQGGSGYANNASWGGAGGNSGGGPVSAPVAQSPSGAAGYGNQGYGYGGYGGNEGQYGNPAAYGAVGGRVGGAANNSSMGGSAGGEQQSGGGGYMGGGYGDAANGNLGYGNQGWRSDPSQANYGGNGSYGGFGGTQARQTQQ